MGRFIYFGFILFFCFNLVLAELPRNVSKIYHYSYKHKYVCVLIVLECKIFIIVLILFHFYFFLFFSATTFHSHHLLSFQVNVLSQMERRPQPVARRSLELLPTFAVQLPLTKVVLHRIDLRLVNDLDMEFNNLSSNWFILIIHFICV